MNWEGGSAPATIPTLGAVCRQVQTMKRRHVMLMIARQTLCIALVHWQLTTRLNRPLQGPS